MEMKEREEKEIFCKESAEYFGHHVDVKWESMNDEDLNKFYDWFDYLWDK